MFKDFRDMNKFDVIVKECESSDINMIAKHYQRNILRIVTGTSRTHKTNEELVFEIPMTDEEYDLVYNECVMQVDTYIYTHAWDSPRIFKDKYWQALNILKYDKAHDFCVGCTSTGECTDNYAFEYDILNCFIKNYKNILSYNI